MKWVLRLALVGLVSLAESRSINYEYEDKQGLESEQEGYAGDVTGKYETMDHNGNIVEIKYIADHMGFRLMDELEVINKNINSPNAELEIEPTEHKTQTEEQTTNESSDSSAKLAEQTMETTAQTTLVGMDNEGEEAVQDNIKTEKQLQANENEAEVIVTGEVMEGGEVEPVASETEGTEVVTLEVEGTEAGESESEVAEGEEADGEEAEVEEVEGEEEAEGEEEEEEAEGEEEDAEGEEEEEEEPEGEEAEGEEAEGEEAEGEEAEAEEAGQKEMVIEEDIAISKRKGDDLQYHQLTEILQMPTKEFEQISTLPKKRIGSKQETIGRSGKAKALVSVKNIGNTPISDARYKQMTQILQVPSFDFRIPQPVQVINVNNINTDEQEIVYYDGQSSDVSSIKINDVVQEMNILPKRTVSITSKQLNNINPGTVIIEKTSISESQGEPEVVLVHMNEPGRLTIEEHPDNNEISVDPFSKRSSMKIGSETIDEKDLSISDDPKIIVREVFTSDGPAPSQQMDSQPKINNIDTESIVTITSKQLNNINPGTIMIERTSISDSQSEPESVLVHMEEPGKLTITAQPVKKEIAIESLGKRTSLEIEPFQQLLEARSKIETVEAEPLTILPIYPNPSKVNLGLVPITIETSLADNMPEFTDDHEMVIETEVIEDIPVPMALIQPSVTSDINAPKQILRFVPKPTPVLLQQTPSIKLFKEAPTTIEMISQQPTPKEIRIIEVRSAPKPMTILDTQIISEVVTEDVTSGEIQSFKVRDFVRF